PAHLERLGLASAETTAKLDAKMHTVVDAAAGALTEQMPGSNQLRVRPGLFPDPATVDRGIRGDLREMEGERFRELADYRADELVQVKFAAVMSDVLARNMERDPRIVVMGEDVHRLRGGVSGATRGALERWPERVLAMPIAENGFTGVALGAALNCL